MEVRRVGELLLGETALLAKCEEIGCKCLKRIRHRRDYYLSPTSVLQTIVFICSL